MVFLKYVPATHLYCILCTCTMRIRWKYGFSHLNSAFSFVVRTYVYRYICIYISKIRTSESLRKPKQYWMYTLQSSDHTLVQSFSKKIYDWLIKLEQQRHIKNAKSIWRKLLLAKERSKNNIAFELEAYQLVFSFFNLVIRFQYFGSHASHCTYYFFLNWCQSYVPS